MLQRSQQYCFFTLDLPRDNENNPLMMEQVLSAIHGAKITLSFEIWTKKGIIQFALWCKRKDRCFIKSILENHYQGMVIRESENLIPEKGYFQELMFDIADIFPIRRYSQVADNITKVHTDPWNELLAPLQRRDVDEVKGMQFVIAPHKWHRKADHTLRIFKNADDWWIFQLYPSLGDTFIRAVYRSWFLRTVFLWLSQSKESDRIDHRDHGKESLAESAKAKLAQLSFRVTIRLVCSGEKPEKLNEIASGFAQFNTKKLNSFKSTPPKKFISLRKSRKKMELCLEELAGMLAFPTVQVKIPELRRVAFKVLQAPLMEGKNDILIGQTPWKEKNLYLPRKDVKGHIAIVGRTGSGKSTIILQLVQDIINQGKGFCILDPHGDLVDTIAATIPLERAIDTVFIDPSDEDYPPAFNMFASNIAKDQLLASINDTFKKIFFDFWGPRTEQVLRNTLRLAICDPKANIMSIPKILSDKEYRKKLLALNDDPLVETYWKNEFPTSKRLIEDHASPLRNKVSQFLETPALRNILGQSQNKIDFRKAIRNQEIVLIKLAKGLLGESNATLLGNFFLHSIAQVAFSEERKYRKDFSVFVDEMQIFAGVSDGIFKNILEEGRKYGLHLRLAFQHLSQISKELESSIFGNNKALISFALNVDDSGKISKYLEEVSNTDLVNIPQYFGYLRVVQDSTLVISSFKTITPKNTEQSYTSIIRELSRVKYCRNRNEVEKEIKEYLQSNLPIPS